MERTEVEQRTARLLVEYLGIEPSSVTPDAKVMDDLGADSLDAIQLIMASEDEFGISIDDDEADKITTVAELNDAVVLKLAA